MPLRRNDLRAGAYVADPASKRLFEVRDDPAPDQKTIRLTDVSSPTDRPRIHPMALLTALARLELVRHAPHDGDVASEATWGACGVEGDAAA